MQVENYLNSTMQSQVSNRNLNFTKTKNMQSASSALEGLKSLGGKDLSTLYLMEFSQQTLNLSLGSLQVQSGSFALLNSNVAQNVNGMLQGIDFSAIGYNGKDIFSMNSDELNFLVSEEGFFGIENTATRIADFIIQGAGDDLEKLQKGFEGMKLGFEQAEKMWGGELPKISQDTISQAIEKVSAKIDELGGKSLDVEI